MSISVEDNKTLIRDYVETWNRGDLQKLCGYWSPDMLHHSRTRAHGYEEVKGIIGGFMTAFPDLNWEINDIVAEGDRVVTRMTGRGTHTGAYMGLPPTGKKINCSVMGIARVDKGKLAEHWGVTDELAIAAQIGLLPQEFLAAME